MTLHRYYNENANRLSKQLAELTKNQQRAAAVSTMLRHPSFVSDDWLDAVGNGTRKIVRFTAIDYTGVYVSCRIVVSQSESIGTQTFMLIGCPRSSAFRVAAERWHALQSADMPSFITRFVGDDGVSLLLQKFVQTGQLDVDDLRSASNICFSILPVLNAYRRLKRMTDRGFCLIRNGICDGCLEKSHMEPVRSFDSDAFRPFPDEFYD